MHLSSWLLGLGYFEGALIGAMKGGGNVGRRVSWDGLGYPFRGIAGMGEV